MAYGPLSKGDEQVPTVLGSLLWRSKGGEVEHASRFRLRVGSGVDGHATKDLGWCLGLLMSFLLIVNLATVTS